MSPIESENPPHAPVPSNQKPSRIIAVFGAASLAEDSPAYRSAFTLGAEIARRGWAVASGGYGGTMAAASRGAFEAGGHTIGVTCETLSQAGRTINPWIREEIRCETIRERMVTLCRKADTAVALDGGIGTLAEISFFWVQIQTGELSPRPLLAVGPAWRETFEAFLHASGKYIREEDGALLMFSASAQDAVERINEFFSSQPSENRKR